MSRRVFLGIDCGTQSTKAILLDAASGAPIGLGRAGHVTDERPDGTREQDPADWIEATTAAVREVLSAAGAVTVAGIGVSGQQHGLVALDDRGHAVRPAKLWNDTTTVEECRLLTDALGGRESVLDLIGNVFLAGYTAPKVLWLRRHEPEAYRSARRFCLPHDLLDLWLSGAFVTEHGDASGTAYFDVVARGYCTPVLAAIDDSRRWDDSLPAIVPSLSIIGQLRPDAAAALGLEPGIPLSAGGGDNMCAAIGIGAVAQGPVVVSLGTSGVVFGRRDAPAIDPVGEAAAFCDSTGGWLPLVCTLNGTGPADWVRSLTGLDLPSFELALATTPAGARGLSFLPYLAGERTPDLPASAGALAGLRARHGAADLVRAVAEGVCFGLAYGMAALLRTGVEPSVATLVGGGAASDAWAQLLADVLGLPVVRPPSVEAAALGAARQARWVVDDVAPASVEPGSDRWEPRQDSALAEAAARHDALRCLAMEGRL